MEAKIIEAEQKISILSDVECYESESVLTDSDTHVCGMIFISRSDAVYHLRRHHRESLKTLLDGDDSRFLVACGDWFKCVKEI